MMLHMTNSLVVPYMVWTDSTLDLEWFYGPDPQQGKYPHDLLRAEAIGRQTGNLPLVLAAVQNTKSKEQAAAAERTRFGTMMVHEIKFRYARGSKEPMEKVLAFGYGRGDCRVHNYWEPGYPVRASNPQAKSLLLRRGGECLLVLCTWNRKPETVTVTLDPKLLGGRAKTATDEETDAALAIQGNTLRIRLEGYGVRLVRIR
jgi:hypothetical protein